MESTSGSCHGGICWFGIILTVSSVLLLLRVVMVLPWRKRTASSRTTRNTPVKTLIVLGSGGHTAEMFRMMRGIKKTNYSPRVYVVANTDKHSNFKLQEFEGENKDWEVKFIPRSREVGQSYLSSIFTTLYAMLFSFVLILRVRPDVMICNGPGTCVPLCIANTFLKIIGKKTTLIYVESICRVEDLSLSAKLLYLFIDRLFVQWKQLCSKYSKAEYIGLVSY